MPNLLLITADDMNWDAVGAYGCPVSETTPNLDRLASQGIRFEHGHVTIAVCQPSRSVMMTGRYPHRAGGEGFHHLRHSNVPILPAILRQHGFATGILGKVAHSTPHADFAWDMTCDMDDLGHGRNPALYAEHASRFFEQAKEQGRPFFLMANSHDPHRPFVGNDPADWYEPQPGQPEASRQSRLFQPEEVTVPGFLPDLPEVRREIAEYYTSVRRCDDTIGALLRSLDRSGLAEDTLILFLSDNGMAFPFAKTNCYLNSTRTPWIMRWPKLIAPGQQDVEHLVSGIDILPTFLVAAGIPLPEGCDGRSFLPILQGKKQEGRAFLFTQFHETAGRRRYPMRCVQTRSHGYIFNPWSDGVRLFKNESQAGRTFPAMREAAESRPEVAERVDLFLHRTVEEFYHFETDPDALDNRIADRDDPDLLQLQTELERWMSETEDPALEAYHHRHDAEYLARWMSAIEAP